VTEDNSKDLNVVVGMDCGEKFARFTEDK